VLKSQIPWKNFCMRKFGGNLYREIAKIGIEQSLKIMKYKTQKLVEDYPPMWVSTQVISDTKK